MNFNANDSPLYVGDFYDKVKAFLKGDRSVGIDFLTLLRAFWLLVAPSSFNARLNTPHLPWSRHKDLNFQTAGELRT